jgi:hypothetical protein
MARFCCDCLMSSNAGEANAKEKALWPFVFTAAYLLNPNPNPIAPIPGNRFRADIFESGLPEAIKTDFLFGKLELAAERAALHHLKKPRRVSLLDMMKQHLTSEAEVAALA